MIISISMWVCVVGELLLVFIIICVVSVWVWKLRCCSSVRNRLLSL